MHWLVFGFSGVTCSGKTTQVIIAILYLLKSTLCNSFYFIFFVNIYIYYYSQANMLKNYLSDTENQALLFSSNMPIKIVKLISQDDYFLPINHPNHIWIKHLNHINWDILTALDMDRMCNDIKEIIGTDYTLHTKEESLLDNNFYQQTTQQQSPVELNILIIEGFLIYNHPAIAELCQLKFHLHIPYEICYQRRSNRTYEPADVPGYFEFCIWPMYQEYLKNYIEQDNVIMLNGGIQIEKCFNYILNCIKNVL